MFTDTLNGELILSQNGTQRNATYISSATPLNQHIQINKSDMASIANASYVTVYWFVDCQYMGQSEDWNQTQLFRKENATHNIEALLVASFEPRPVPTPPTTTTPATTTTSTTTTSTTPATTTTSTTTTTTTTTSTTTPKSTTTTTTTQAPKRKKRDVNSDEHAKEVLEILAGKIDTQNIMNSTGAWNPPKPADLHHIDQPFVCFNNSNVPPDPKKVYGYFSRNITVKSEWILLYSFLVYTDF